MWFAALLGASLALCGCRGAQAPVVGDSPDSTVEAYNRSVAALMWPGATRAFQVTPEGDLFNGAWFVRIVPRSGGFVTADPPGRIAYEERWCPVTRWTRRSPGMLWSFEAVAFPEAEPAPWSPRGVFARDAAARSRERDRASEAAAFAGIPPARLAELLYRAPHPLVREPVDRRNLFISMRVTVTNTGTSEAQARLGLWADSSNIDAPYPNSDSLVRTPWEHCWRVASGRDSVLGVVSGEDTAGQQPRYVLRTRNLDAGKSATWDAVLSAYPAPRAKLQKLAKVSHERRVNRARAYWNHETSRGATFGVPDPEVNRAVRAARVVLLASRERRDRDWVSIGGPFHYRDLWIRDGVRVAEALAVSGYTRESRECARALLRFQTPFGSFVSQSGQLDGTGQVLWAFEQTMLRPSPAADVPRLAREGLRALRAIEHLRDLTSPPKPGEFPGMLPETDPHDNELVRAQLVGNDAWSLAGYRSVERLLRASRKPEAADSVERARLEYLGEFRLALERSGSADVPPSWQGPGIDWGNLNVSWPCGVLDATDPRMAALANRYWAPVGGPGLGYYRNPDSLHTYVAADLGTVALLAGDRVAADSMLDAMLQWRSASGGAAECFAGSTWDFGKNFPPHTTAAAAFLSLVRNALVFDDADTLALTLGARSRWWAGTTVSAAPTRWGLLHLNFARTGDVATWRWSGVPVWTLLALPPGTRAAAVEAPLRPGPRPNTVLAPPGTTQAHVALTGELAP